MSEKGWMPAYRAARRPSPGTPRAAGVRLALFLAFLGVLGMVAACRRESSESPGSPGPAAEFLSLMQAGRNHLGQGDATNALVVYGKAAALMPGDPDVRLNLANALLVDGQSEAALREADEALKRDPNSAAAYFIRGSAHLRLSRPAEAVKAFDNTLKLDPGEAATFFQLGLARMGLQQWEGAITAFRAGLAMDPNHLHAAAHYQLAQALLRAGRTEEAQKELERHQGGAEAGAPGGGVSPFERSRFTLPRVPFRLDQPSRHGVAVRFVDATRDMLGSAATSYAGPAALVNANQKAWNSLFVFEPGRGFRLLWNTNGVFTRDDRVVAGLPGATPARMLVGDLQNDRFDDVIVLGDRGTQVLRFGTNGSVADVSASSGIADLNASEGLLADLDFTGKLDLVAVTHDTHELRVFRQSSPLLFHDVTRTSGVPPTLHSAHRVLLEDWNRDQMMDLVASRSDAAPLLLEKVRGGGLASREMTNWVAGAVACTGDFDNDLRPDMAVVGEGRVVLCLNGGEQRSIEAGATAGIRQLIAVDYDNDGWLDLWAVGDRVRAWRNLGAAGFEEQTATLGLDRIVTRPVTDACVGDLDGDCDEDVVLMLAGGGLQVLRNEGANANSLLKVRLYGTRSNASGIGSKVEIEAGGLRLLRTVQQLPVEVGVGRHQKLDSFLVHWFNWAQGAPGIAVDCREPLIAHELSIQEGSCPYLYAWDGTRFRFVTDILGASPLGLPVARGRYVEADPEEWVWIGDESLFHPRNGGYEVQITEELREVLYLDQAGLVIADHPSGTEVHPTGKLLPGGPFPRTELVTLHREHPLVRAEGGDGRDVTALLRTVDGLRASPPGVRVPQLRGLAASHAWILDFGPLDVSRPLVLVMNGWLRFGGGMANIAASDDPSLPFPFPRLDAEVAPGTWKPVPVVVGAPAGKTKTILVDLGGKLEPGTRRLRLTGAFEIHWDRIALLEHAPRGGTRLQALQPERADLHFRGFSALRTEPADAPITPNYEAVSRDFYWSLIPEGWSTRYGDVTELVGARDEGLALVHSGDELTLRFNAAGVPPVPSGFVRDYFLHVDGWDKDSDFHVVAGTRIEPLPFHGMSSQEYGREPRPPFASDDLHRKYNTRWVEGRVLKPTASR